MTWFKIVLIIVVAISLVNCANLPWEVASRKPDDSKSKGEVQDVKVSIPAGNTPTSAANSSATKTTAEVIDIAPGKVVFLRSSIVASAVEANIYDVTSGRPKFIANVTNNTQVHHKVLPGKYIFLLNSDESLDYLTVNVVSNRTFYSVVKPSMGAWKPSFSLLPIKQRVIVDENREGYFFEDTQVEALLSTMTPIVDTEDLEKPTGSVAKQLLDKHRQGWASWSKQPPEKREQKTLHVVDGR